MEADRHQTDRLLASAEPLDADRVWAIDSAAGLGRLLAQQLVAAGERVVDVPPTLAARVRLLARRGTCDRALSSTSWRPRSWISTPRWKLAGDAGFHLAVKRDKEPQR